MALRPTLAPGHYLVQDLSAGHSFLTTDELFKTDPMKPYDPIVVLPPGSLASTVCAIIFQYLYPMDNISHRLIVALRGRRQAEERQVVQRYAVRGRRVPGSDDAKELRLEPRRHRSGRRRPPVKSHCHVDYQLFICK